MTFIMVIRNGNLMDRNANKKKMNWRMYMHVNIYVNVDI